MDLEYLSANLTFRENKMDEYITWTLKSPEKTSLLIIENELGTVFNIMARSKWELVSMVPQSLQSAETITLQNWIVIFKREKPLPKSENTSQTAQEPEKKGFWQRLLG